MTDRCVASGRVVLSAFLVFLWAGTASGAGLPEEAKTALLAGKFEDVLKAVQQIKLGEADAPCRLAVAHACLGANRNNQGLLLLLSSMKPEDVRAWDAWTKRFQEANPANAIACYLRGDALARSGQNDAAEQWFTRAIRHKPKMGMAHVARGALRALAGREDEAYEDFFQATQVQPRLALAHASLGCYWVAEEVAEPALEAFNQALKLDPDFALAYNGRGCAYYGWGQPDKAARDFSRAEELFPALAATTDANQVFVRAMVADTVDEHTLATRGAGTTLETKLQSLDLTTMSDKQIRDLVRQEGAGPVQQRYWQQRREIISQVRDATAKLTTKQRQEMKRLETNVLISMVANDVYTGAGLTIAALSTAGIGPFVVAGVKSIGTDVALLATEGVPGKPGMLVRTGIAGAASLDPFAASLRARLELDNRAQNTYFKTLGPNLAKAVAPFLPQVNRLRGIKAVLNGEAARQMVIKSGVTGPKPGRLTTEQVATASVLSSLKPLEGASEAASRMAKKGPLTTEQIGKALIVSGMGMPWKQMPALSEEISQLATNNGGPVAIVSDRITPKSFALQRMLDNQGIASITVSPAGSKNVAQLQRALGAGAVVGFPQLRDDGMMFRDDDKKKYVPGPPGGQLMPIPALSTALRPPPPPPDGGGGGGGAAISPASGLPRIDAIRAKYWNGGRPWTPKGKSGGVDLNMDWVFVVKGDWPVATFFTLAYTSPVPDRAAPEEQD